MREDFPEFFGSFFAHQIHISRLKHGFAIAEEHCSSPKISPARNEYRTRSVTEAVLREPKWLRNVFGVPASVGYFEARWVCCQPFFQILRGVHLPRCAVHLSARNVDHQTVP